jgi:tetratricopeptide (TPR) repeat protein
MGAGKGSSERHVIPRWRSVPRTIAAGEFQQRQSRRPLESHQSEEVDEFESQWRREGGAFAAAEFAGACLVAGTPDRAAATHELLAHDQNKIYRLLAERILDGPAKSGTDVVDSDIDPPRIEEEFRRKIAHAKARTLRDPRNAIAWGDLARRYTALGQTTQAETALRIARALAPTSRYLLRSATRFLVQVGRADEALYLLSGSPRTSTDPWLMSASLSVAATADLPVRNARNARRIVESGGFRPIELSELESELATLELKSGADRKARGLFRQSLGHPTDNSLAQIEWASQFLPSLEVEPEHVDVPFAAEARSRSAAQEGSWRTALKYGIDWMDDQPFDAQAAIHASYVASVGMDEWRTSALLADMGLRANPTNLTLLNNMAYALIEMGDLEGAKVFLERAVGRSGEEGDRVAILATQGLMRFREGDLRSGRAFYSNAINVARSTKDRDAEAMAWSMLLREELTTGIIESLNADSANEMSTFAKEVRDSGVRRSVERVLRLAGLMAQNES